MNFQEEELEAIDELFKLTKENIAADKSKGKVITASVWNFGIEGKKHAPESERNRFKMIINQVGLKFKKNGYLSVVDCSKSTDSIRLFVSKEPMYIEAVMVLNSILPEIGQDIYNILLFKLLSFSDKEVLKKVKDDEEDN